MLERLFTALFGGERGRRGNPAESHVTQSPDNATVPRAVRETRQQAQDRTRVPLGGAGLNWFYRSPLCPAAEYFSFIDSGDTIYTPSTSQGLDTTIARDLDTSQTSVNPQLGWGFGGPQNTLGLRREEYEKILYVFGVSAALNWKTRNYTQSNSWVGLRRCCILRETG